MVALAAFEVWLVHENSSGTSPVNFGSQLLATKPSATAAAAVALREALTHW